MKARSIYRSRRYEAGPDCRVCGYKRVNVRHEQDPDNAPEGRDYFAPMKAAGELHEFVAEDGQHGWRPR